MAFRMTAQQAAQDLETRLANNPAIRAIGISDTGAGPVIVVYVRSMADAMNIAELRDRQWLGYPIVIKKMSTPRIVSTIAGAVG